jgi:hypothetical protein
MDRRMLCCLGGAMAVQDAVSLGLCGTAGYEERTHDLGLVMQSSAEDLGEGIEI